MSFVRTKLRGLSVQEEALKNMFPNERDKVQDQIGSDDERGAGRLLRQMLSSDQMTTDIV
jgi:hypothetical protein